MPRASALYLTVGCQNLHLQPSLRCFNLTPTPFRDTRTVSHPSSCIPQHRPVSSPWWEIAASQVPIVFMNVFDSWRAPGVAHCTRALCAMPHSICAHGAQRAHASSARGHHSLTSLADHVPTFELIFLAKIFVVGPKIIIQMQRKYELFKQTFVF